ncbi:hypothetical protein R3W88_026850 [Solanum pinnatisectum]|uniref:Uncharacterized protein n=1 Tax=Solanum pinnatisectum TaxID=50273 RepID=A0AAV9LEE4_9SOLN|nr:hypothetical protein R3W88_026850 [Solanum pinnatisectum]
MIEVVIGEFFQRLEVVNSNWLHSRPSCKENYLSEGMSDHCPARISLQNQTNRSKRTFQYCNVWSQHPLFNMKKSKC